MIITMPEGLADFFEQIMADENLSFNCVGWGCGSAEYETAVDLHRIRRVMKKAVVEAIINVTSKEGEE